MALKSGDKLKIDQKWWTKNNQIPLKTTGLGAAMKAYTDAKGLAVTFSSKGLYSSQKEREKSPIDIAKEKLADVVKTAAKAKGMCNKSLHKDVIKVLDTVGVAEKAETKALATLESNFNKAYLKNVLLPLTKQAGEAVQKFTQRKTDANALMKAVAEDLKMLGGTVKYAKAVKRDDPYNTGEMKKILSESTVRFKKMKKAQKAVDTMQSESEVEAREAKSITNDVRIGDSDRDKHFAPMINNINGMRNAVSMYQNKINLMIATGEGHLQAIESTLSGKPSTTGDHEKILTKVADALVGWGQDARRQNNNLTPWQADVRRFVAAKRRATGGKTLEDIAKEMSIKEPPSTWKKIADDYVTKAPTFMKKTVKMLKQAEELKAKSLAKVPQPVLGLPNIKAQIEKIDDKIKEIRDYTQKNKDSFTELEKAAQTLAS